MMGSRVDGRLTTHCRSCSSTTPTLTQTQTLNQLPQAGDLGITDARIIASGDAQRSVLWARMNRTDNNRMPPIASSMPVCFQTIAIPRAPLIVKAAVSRCMPACLQQHSVYAYAAYSKAVTFGCMPVLFQHHCVSERIADYNAALPVAC